MSEIHINQATITVAAQADMSISSARSLVREHAEGLYIEQQNMHDLIHTARARNQNNKIQNQQMDRDARSENSNDGL